MDEPIAPQERTKPSNVWLIVSRFPLHPFAFAALIIVSIILDNKYSVLPQEIYSTALIIEAGVAALLAVFILAFRNAAKAGLAATIFVFLSLNFLLFRTQVWSLATMGNAQIDVDLVALLIYIAVAVILIVALSRDRWHWVGSQLTLNHGKTCLVLNCISLMLLACYMTVLADYEIETYSWYVYLSKEFQRPFANLKLKDAAQKRDVYFIVLDGFAHPRSLEEMWGYNDADFLSYLKDRGFYITSQSASNYDRPCFTLSSSLNMQYLDIVPDSVGRDPANFVLQWHLVQNNPVLGLFKRLGYKLVNVSSGLGGTNSMPTADYNFSSGTISQVGAQLLLLTPLSLLDRQFNILRQAYGQSRLAADSVLPAVLKVRGPKFVLVHVPMPDPPFIFDDRGAFLPVPLEQSINDNSDKAAYLGQLKYTEARVKSWIAEILKGYDSSNQPIIILQSSHGPDFVQPVPGYFNERMRILSAFYLPGIKNGLYDRISPVNDFRLLFKTYFAANLPMLPDRSYCAPPLGRPYWWTDVTGELSFDKTP